MSTSTVPITVSTTSASSGGNPHLYYHNSHHQSQGGDSMPVYNQMNQQSRYSSHYDMIEIKSKFEAEFRRFSVQRSEITNLDDFIKLIEHFHKLFSIPFCLFYTDPIHGDLLPISNDTNFALAIASAKPLLRLIIQRKGESIDFLNSSSAYGKKKNFFGTILPTSSSGTKNRLAISAPEDFRQVSSIIDVDIVPDTCRRVRLVKHGSDKPLGFYIRDGTSVRVTMHGLERGPGIFISRLVPGGLAESTGLLAVNDEVLEVNGIEVNGKSLDQVTDMMVANSSNLIITIRPANQQGIHHSTLSSSFNTISTTTPYLAPTHQAQYSTNSLERSGHRSKVAGYNQSMIYRPESSQYFSGADSSSNLSSQHILHQVSPQAVIDDDDEDEDEIRDHFTISTSNNGANRSQQYCQVPDLSSISSSVANTGPSSNMTATIRPITNSSNQSSSVFLVRNPSGGGSYRCHMLPSHGSNTSSSYQSSEQGCNKAHSPIRKAYTNVFKLPTAESVTISLNDSTSVSSSSSSPNTQANSRKSNSSADAHNSNIDSDIVTL